ncbi:MAG: CBS domain-containing protein [Gammaproteobacteria bacterium]
MSIGTICNREVVIVGKNDTLLEAAQLMRDYHVGDVVVVEERDGRRYPLGVLTDRDIVIELIAKDVATDAVMVGDVVGVAVALAREDDDIGETIKFMRQKGVRRLPVVDGLGALIGIVTLDDLIDIIAEQMQDLAALIGKQQSIEKKYRD